MLEGIYIFQFLKNALSFLFTLFLGFFSNDIVASETSHGFLFPIISNINERNKLDGLTGGKYHLDLRIRAEYFAWENDLEKSQYGKFAEIRGSFFFSELISIHLKSIGEAIKTSEDDWRRAYFTKMFVAQIGSLGFSQIRFYVGRAQLPFGLNEPVIKGCFQTQFARDLYDSPKNVAVLSWDNKTNLNVDIGGAVSSSKKLNRAYDSTLMRPEEKAVSLRFIYDFEILGSTRSVVSIFAHNDGRRRWSLGLLTIGQQKEETHIDIVREISSPDGRRDPFRQRIRFGYKGAIQNKARWSFELDDEIDVITVGGLHYELNIFSYLWYSQGIGYRRLLDESQKKGWMVFFGLGTQL